MRRVLLTCLSLVIIAAAGCGDSTLEEPSAVLRDGALLIGSTVVLDGLPASGVRIAGAGGDGVLLEFTTTVDSPGIQRWGGIELAGADKLLAIYRMKPWWTRPGWPGTEQEIPRETEALLWRCQDNSLGVLLPLLADGWRFSLEGDSAGLAVVADNNMPIGDPGAKLAGLWVSTGADPYELLASSFRAVARATGNGTPVADKPHPGWADMLGWASWYAFWQDVNEDKFLAALQSMDSAGIRPGYVLLDDGWQDATPDRNLIRSFAPDSTKFPNGLGWLVRHSKQQFGIEKFMVWHTLEGYWRGIDSTSGPMSDFPQFRSMGRSNRPMPTRYRGHLSGEWNVPRPEAAEALFRGYHGYLAARGVDGVKVDNQSDISYMTYGLGPLAEVTERYVRGLENSAVEHFGPASVLNCMSMVTDCIYNYRRTTIMRTSTDFFPDSTSSWGPHLVLNAYNGLVWGNVIRPDWDMFLSGHEWAAYHAAARAISGGPVYLSDSPGEHNPALVAKVALPDRRVLRPLGAAVPTADILFNDPQTEHVLLKLANHNRAGGLLLAAFHANNISKSSITGSMTLDLNPHAEHGSTYAVIETSGQSRPVLRNSDESWNVNLGEGEFAVFAAARLERGVAVLGRLGMFNPGGAVLECGWSDGSTYIVSLACGGTIGLYSENEPLSVEQPGAGRLAHTFDSESGLLTVMLVGNGEQELLLRY